MALNPAFSTPSVADPRYLEYFELFQREKFFEAHEVLEGLWRETSGETREFYQGLIQWAAALVHFQKGNFTGARELFRTASVYLKPYLSPYEGLDLAKALKDFQKFLEVWSKNKSRPSLARRFLPRLDLGKRSE